MWTTIALAVWAAGPLAGPLVGPLATFGAEGIADNGTGWAEARHRRHCMLKGTAAAAAAKYVTGSDAIRTI